MRNLYLSLLTVFLLVSCKKKEIIPANPKDYLPPATQIGANELAWRADSVPYVSKGYNFCFLHIDTTASTCNFKIQTTFVTNGGYQFAIQLTPPNELQYPIAADTFIPMQYGTMNGMFENPPGNANAYNEIVLGAQDGGITITHFDPAKRIISGTFNFTTTKFPSYPSHTVTDGWFDIVYTIY